MNNQNPLVVVAGIIAALISVVIGFSMYFTSPKGEPQAGAVSSPDVQSYLSVNGLLTTRAGHTHSARVATSSTATSQTLVASDITRSSSQGSAAIESIVFTPNTNSTTLTFPATSTLPSTFLPNAGDWAEQCWVNGTSTAAKTITFAAGTGWDFEAMATSTGTTAIGLYAVQPGNSACFRFMRKPATASAFDIIAQFSTFTDAD